MDSATLFFIAVVVECVITCCLISNVYDAVVRRKRRARLLAKYGDPAIVEKIIAQTIWQGETAEMLVDSAGQPDDIDHKVLKSRSRETWKYARTGRNRFRNRVILENGVVVGWDLK